MLGEVIISNKNVNCEKFKINKGYFLLGERQLAFTDFAMQNNLNSMAANTEFTNDIFYYPYSYMADATLYNLVFYVYDHLGNTRITYKPLESGGNISYELQNVADYYPYGKMLREYISGQQEKYLTTHHERDVETGFDYRGARFYDSDLGRFLSLDALADNYSNQSNYCYAYNNPNLFIDPTGRSAAGKEKHEIN